MLGVKPINYLYEDDNIKIINPNKEQREELYNLIEKLQIEEDTIDNPELILEMLKELVITNEPVWDFNRCSVEEMRVILTDIELYPSTLSNAVREIEDLALNIILKHYLDLNNQLQKKMIELEMVVAQTNINNVKNKTKELEDIVEKAKIIQAKAKAQEKEGKKKSPKQLIKELLPNLSRKQRRTIEKEYRKLDKEYLELHPEITEEDFGVK
jgi:hypothetical protein